MKPLPKVSIIIPCYNHGDFLQEALANLSFDDSFYEVLIINDGSQENHTKAVLRELKQMGFHVIEQENKGLSEARNTGISVAKGEYIMLLDSDNKLEPSFLHLAAKELDLQQEVAVVYSDAMYFGKRNSYWKVGGFNLQRLMIANYIDACAMVRKDVFFELGGYDVNMKGGWEDWELWLRFAFAGKKFLYIPKVGFWYRVNDHSMSGGLGKNTAVRNELKVYLHKKYPHLLGHDYITSFVTERLRKNPFTFVLKLIVVTWFPTVYRNLLKKNKVIRGL